MKIFNVNVPFGTKRLRLDFNHLHEQKFTDAFMEILNPLRSCSIQVEAKDNITALSLL